MLFRSRRRHIPTAEYQSVMRKEVYRIEADFAAKVKTEFNKMIEQFPVQGV